MFTDMAGYTTLSHSDESAALQLVEEQEELVRPLLNQFRGREVKSTGDGFLVEFDSALQAVQCAVELQRRVHERNTREGVRPLRLRVGIHLGDVQQRGTDIFGDAVNIASRVEPLAEVGGVCISEHVFAQVHNKVAHQFESLGPRALKGVHDPVQVYRVLLPWTAQSSAPAGPTPPRLAVLPLANISADPKDEYFADGLTEELISVLSQIRGLRVIARTSVNQYKATSKSVAQIGSELGVTSVLEGSVRKSGNRLRITLQLIDVGTQEHEWSANYNRDLEDVFAIQAEVAEQTAGALKLQLLKSEQKAIQEKPTSNLAAYDAYLRGIQASRRLDLMEEADRTATACFEEAIQLDPKFSAAYSALANHLIQVMGVTRPAKEVFPRARALLATALELNPASPEAHLALGNLAMQAELAWAPAEAEFQEAIRLNPSYAEAHYWYAQLLSVLQRYDESKKQYDLAIELDPLWVAPSAGRAWLCWLTGDAPAALAAGKELVAKFGGSTLAHGTYATLLLLDGRMDEAMAEGRALGSSTDHFSQLSYAAFLAWAGKPEMAREALRALEAHAGTPYISAGLLATFQVLVGENDRALDLLEKDLREGDKTLWAHYNSFVFDPIRDNPRFTAMLRAMGIPTTHPPHRMALPRS